MSGLIVGESFPAVERFLIGDIIFRPAFFDRIEGLPPDAKQFYCNLICCAHIHGRSACFSVDEFSWCYCSIPREQEDSYIQLFVSAGLLKQDAEDSDIYYFLYHSAMEEQICDAE